VSMVCVAEQATVLRLASASCNNQTDMLQSVGHIELLLSCCAFGHLPLPPSVAVGSFGLFFGLAPCCNMCRALLWTVACVTVTVVCCNGLLTTAKAGKDTLVHTYCRCTFPQLLHAHTTWRLSGCGPALYLIRPMQGVSKWASPALTQSGQGRHATSAQQRDKSPPRRARLVTYHS
jgi:hypothetical protein